MSEQIKKTPILCLDLDGTVRHSASGAKFIKDADDIAIFPGVAEILDEYKAKGWLIVGVSNQGSIAHGIKTDTQVVQELARTAELLPQFRIIRACPAMGDGTVYPFNWRSLQRKPYYGMLASIEDELMNGICIPDWDNSLFVGDREEDEACAANADIAFEHADVFFKRVDKVTFMQLREEAQQVPDFLAHKLYTVEEAFEYTEEQKAKGRELYGESFIEKDPGINYNLSSQDISDAPVAATAVLEPEYTEIAGTAALLQDTLTDHTWGNYFENSYPQSHALLEDFIRFWARSNDLVIDCNVYEDFYHWPLAFQLGVLGEFASKHDGGWSNVGRFFQHKHDFTNQINNLRTFFIGLEAWMLKHTETIPVKDDTAFI